MKKVLLSLAIVTIATLSAKAQSDSKSSDSQFKLDIGATAALPIGDLSNVSSFGVGGFLKGAYSVSPNFDVTLTPGYISFIGKTVDGYKYSSEGLFSALAGGSYLLDGGFHIDAGIGYGSFSGGGSSAGGFAYQAGVGYRIDGGLNINVNYNGVSLTGGSDSYIGLGISYPIVK